MQIVLCQPEIPQNTGNIIRTCSVTGVGLTLVRPLGFIFSDKKLKRAGLDYHEEVPIEVIDHLPSLLEQERRPFYFFSSKVNKPYTEINYTDSDLLIFGSEGHGLDPFYFERWPDRFVTIPMKLGKRSLNLSNAVAIALYEALRQQRFQPLLDTKVD